VGAWPVHQLDVFVRVSVLQSDRQGVSGLGVDNLLVACFG
jgi:hypothetical protein